MGVTLHSTNRFICFKIGFALNVLFKRRDGAFLFFIYRQKNEFVRFFIVFAFNCFFSSLNRSTNGLAFEKAAVNYLGKDYACFIKDFFVLLNANYMPNPQVFENLSYTLWIACCQYN